MRFSVGTLEINDATRKAIRKETGQKGAATRADAKAWVLEILEREIERITGTEGSLGADAKDEAEPDSEANSAASEELTTVQG